MFNSKINLFLSLSVMSAVCLAGVSRAVDRPTSHASLNPVIAELGQLNKQGKRRYIVRLKEPSVARYNGTNRFAAIPRRADNKIEVNSTAVSTYVNHLKQQQNTFLNDLSAQFNRPVNALLSYQFAINGLAVDLTTVEASVVKQNVAVISVRPDRLYRLDTDAGPTLIGANNVWNGVVPSVGIALGEGIVIGILDTGVNFDHPSFADVGDDAYDHTNPLGSENYVGVCDPSNSEQFIDTYLCNDKLIGGFDFINGLVPDDGSFDIPGPEDENGHGSHTASISAGNVIFTAEANGVTGITISGVAPHANVIVFDVCFNSISSDGCAGAAAIAAVDQAMADGLVDVINYSISGGIDPWNDDVSLAFLSATDSGIYISTSVGDSGPGAGTLGHLEPWTASVGASTHDRVFNSFLSGTTNNGQADVMADFSSRGPSSFEHNKPDLIAPGVNILAAFNDDTVAPSEDEEYGVISGTSMSSPFNAGAAALLKELHPSWSTAEIKSALMLTAVTAGVTKEDGVTPADPFDRGAGRVQVDVASSTGLVMDETITNFLTADPSDGGDPKTLNVASYKNDNCVGTCSFQREFRSVATDPVDYTAGLFGMTGTVNPASFTAMPGQMVTLNIEIEGSALVPGATSFGELRVLPQGPSTDFPMAVSLPIDAGGYQTNDPIANMNCSTIAVSGISQPITVSVELGIDHVFLSELTLKLFNPNGDEFAFLNRPGLPAQFLGSFADLVSTSPITFSDLGTTDAEVMGLNLSFNDAVCELDGLCDYFGNPSEELSSVANFAALAVADPNGDWMLCGGDSFDFKGEPETIIEFATLFFSENTVPDLHMPLVVIGVPNTSDIDVTPTSLSATLDADMTIDLNLNISNSEVAGLPLNWVVDTTSTSNLVDEVYYEQVQTGSFNGILSNLFVDGVTDPGTYAAESFVLTDDRDVDGFVFEGFLTNASNLPDDGINFFTVKVYADAGGLPAGNPEDGGGTELFSATIPVSDYSLEYINIGSPQDGISMNVKNFTGSSWSLTAGTYWVTAYAHVTGPNRWGWFNGIPGNGLLPQFIDPQDFFELGFTAWTDLITVASGDTDYSGLAFNVKSLIGCGASWISYSLINGTLVPGADEDVLVTLDSTGLTPGVYEAAVCVASDDTNEPLVAVPVTLTVDGLSDLIFVDGFESNP